MPRRTPTRCSQCNQLATNAGRCDQHQRKAWANKSANTQTLTGWQRQRIRDEQLAREPQCRACGATTNLQADHIIEIADGGHPTNPDNLQTLCEEHHATKTRIVAAARRRRRTAGQ